MAPTTSHKLHIERRDGVCGGKPCIVGTRIRVQDIYVWHELQGLSPEQIVSDFPQLTLADVHSALAYYFDHREDIERDMRDAESLVEKMKVAQGAGLLDRLRARVADDDSAAS
jgi:uncharacterized protein (DUF433 family)